MRVYKFPFSKAGALLNCTLAFTEQHNDKIYALLPDRDFKAA